MSNSPEKTYTVREMRADVQDTAVLQKLDAASTAVTPEACLVHIHPSGPHLGSRHRVADRPVLIGREPDCPVSVPDRSVSRQHARVVPQPGGGYRVEDLGSTNGTFVNSARVTAAALADGDYLQVGNCIYRFLAGGNLEAEYHEEIHRLTVLDALTGVHNRRSLTEFLDRELDRAKRYERPLAVVLFDIDHFKAVNDRLGHLGGDFTLKAVAARIKGLTRKEELLARYGGEEFALVLPETELPGAVLCGERMRRAVAGQPFEVEGRPFPVTVSVGVAARAGADLTAAGDLLREADARLYEAKRSGRNRVAPPPPAEPGTDLIWLPEPPTDLADPPSPDPDAQP
jgi:diguanylate cyclase (GGDEF)-like protein